MRHSSLATFAFSLLAPFLALTACTTVAEKPAEPETQAPPRVAQEDTIDMLGLQRSLGLDRAPDQLGYEEKAFNTCSAGYGYSSTHDCKAQYLVAIQFRLQCRDSEGTVSTTDHVLTPIASENVRWSLGKQAGVTSTDGEGYGQVVWIAPSSQKNQWLRITVGNQFLALRAGTITRVVTPQTWCAK